MLANGQPRLQERRNHGYQHRYPIFIIQSVLHAATVAGSSSGADISYRHAYYTVSSLSVQTPCLVIRARHAMCGQQAGCQDPGVEISEQWAAVARQTRARTHVCVVSSVKSY